MAESHLNQRSKLEIFNAPAAEEACVWEKLPRELQYKVLCHLPLRTLFQVRCVCKAWRYCILQRAFATVYNAMHSSVPPSVALVYTNSPSPSDIKWSMYDYGQNTWQQMTTLPPHSHPRLGQKGTLYSVHPVGGLLVFRTWNYMSVNSWVVWNPLTNKWKVLPLCDTGTLRLMIGCHAFVADESAKRYKILMAYNLVTWDYEEIEKCTSMVTDLYDSATGVWTRSRFPLQGSLHPWYDWGQGVLSNGVIYFVSRYTSGERVLLAYNIESEQWHDDATVGICQNIFEWDGHLMAALWQDEKVEESWVKIICKWDVGMRKWVETVLTFPQKMINIGFEFEKGYFVAQGNHLVVGEFQDHFRSAIYMKAENCWTCAPPVCGPFHEQEARGCQLLLFKPRLDWTP